MSRALALVAPRDALPAARVLVWLHAALRVLRHAPVRIVLLAFVPIGFEALCQAVPQAGIVLSKLLTPVVGALALLLLDRRVRDGAFGVAGALRVLRGRLPALAGVALLSTGVFAVQLGVAATLAGGDQAVALATGAMAELRMTRADLALMLVAGLVPGLALMTVPARVALDGRGVAQAVADNARVLARAWKPVALSMLPAAAMLAALPWWPAVLLVLLPFGLTLGYAMYRDLFPADAD